MDLYHRGRIHVSTGWAVIGGFDRAARCYAWSRGDRHTSGSMANWTAGSRLDHVISVICAPRNTKFSFSSLITSACPLPQCFLDHHLPGARGKPFIFERLASGCRQVMIREAVPERPASSGDFVEGAIVDAHAPCAFGFLAEDHWEFPGTRGRLHELMLDQASHMFLKFH